MSQVSPQEFPGGATLWNQYPPGPAQITALLAAWLQSKFSRVENLIHPTLRQEKFLWTPDVRDGIGDAPPGSPSMYIGTPYSFRPEQASATPALLVRRQSINLGPRKSIGDKHHTPMHLIGQVDAQHLPTVGHDMLTFSLSGQHDVLCVGTNAAFVELLSCEVFLFLVEYSHLIRKTAGLTELRVDGVGPVSEVEGFDKCWGSSIGVRYTQDMSVVLRHAGPILKAFSVMNSDPESPLLVS